MSLIHFLGGAVVKTLPAGAGDTGEEDPIPGWGRSPGEGNGNPLQYSCLGNPMGGGAWWATVHRVAKSWTGLSTHGTTHNCPGKMEIDITIIQLRNNRHPLLDMSFRDKETRERLSNFPRDKPLARNRADSET